MSGYISTHVLDTARGAPAAGVEITLSYLTQTGAKLVARAVTNADGRTDAPLLAGPDLVAGRYEIVFHAGAYLRATGQVPAPGAGQADLEPLFLDEIPIRFGIADAQAHYHVPLLLQAYGYSTYRGS